MESKYARGVRAVAVFEALKGMIVLFTGFGLFSLMHRNIQAIAERLVLHSHLNPAHHYPRIFLDAVSHIDDAQLRFLAALALLYAGLRLVEAYGLWRMKMWAAWYAIVTGAIYVPIEVYRFVRQATFTGAIVLLINTFVVGYMLYYRMQRKHGAV